MEDKNIIRTLMPYFSGALVGAGLQYLTSMNSYWAIVGVIGLSFVAFSSLFLLFTKLHNEEEDEY